MATKMRDLQRTINAVGWTKLCIGVQSTSLHCINIVHGCEEYILKPGIRGLVANSGKYKRTLGENVSQQRYTLGTLFHGQRQADHGMLHRRWQSQPNWKLEPSWGGLRGCCCRHLTSGRVGRGRLSSGRMAWFGSAHVPSPTSAGHTGTAGAEADSWLVSRGNSSRSGRSTTSSASGPGLQRSMQPSLPPPSPWQQSHVLGKLVSSAQTPHDTSVPGQTLLNATKLAEDCLALHCWLEGACLDLLSSFHGSIFDGSVACSWASRERPRWAKSPACMWLRLATLASRLDGSFWISDWVASREARSDADGLASGPTIWNMPETAESAGRSQPECSHT